MHTDQAGQGPSVAVVGAGVAGLMAAMRLHRAGARVTVFDAHEAPGGRLRTEAVDGFLIDAGIQLLGTVFTALVGSLRPLGLEAAVREMPGRDAMWRDGRVHEVVYGSVASMVASGAIPFATKLRVGASYLPFLARHAEVLAPGRLTDAAALGLDSRSIAAWGERELGAEFVEHLVAPLLGAHYGLTPEETSAALYHMNAAQGRHVRVFTLAGGVGTYAHRLADMLAAGGHALRWRSPVRAVARAARGVEVETADGAECFDAAVVAVPAPVAREIVGDAVPALSAWLEPLRYRGTVAVALLLDRPVGARYFGLSLPRTSFRTLGTLCVGESKPGAVPDGQGLLVAFPQPAAADRLLEADPRDVVDAMLPEVRRALPHVPPHIRRARVYRWPHWNVVFGPGYLARLRDFGRGTPECGAPIALAGDYLCVPGVEGAVRAGNAAADRLLARLAGAHRGG